MSSTSVEKDLEALNRRFIEAMERLGHSGYTLSKALDTSEAVISNIRNHRNPPNIQLIRRLLNKYLELDPDWLLFGRGSMHRGEAAPGTTKASELTHSLKVIEDRMIGMEGLLKRSLQAQLERSVILDETMSELEDRVAGLEKKSPTHSMKTPGKAR